MMRGEFHREPDFDGIAGDALEHHRVHLENQLQNTDISFRPFSATDEEDDGGPIHNHSRSNDSVEYPRHNSEPDHFHDFGSFDGRSRDHFDPGDHSQNQMHAWSYRTGDDDEGINPYAGGETMSTAAHHASRLTLSAGLGGRAGRRDVSLSGAEYDPDRPLQDIIAGVDSKLSVFDIDPSRSKYTGVGSMTFDPLVVEDTAELDRILQSGHAPPSFQRSVRLRSPHSSASSVSSDSESVAGRDLSSTRPRLADHLRHVAFSPKRPRTAPASTVVNNDPPSRHQKQYAPSPLARRVSRNVADVSYAEANLSYRDGPTPRPTRRQQAATTQPELRLHPPTPSGSHMKSTKGPKPSTRDLEGIALSASNPFYENEPLGPAFSGAGPNTGTTSRGEGNSGGNYRYVAPSSRQPTPRKSSLKAPKSTTRVHLPDVTGLTAAVESPMKLSAEYMGYRGDTGARESEVRLVRTLNAVHNKLQHLEEENGISRRRVRELEFELEVCKREVAREQSKVEEHSAHLANVSARRPAPSGSKGKGKAKGEVDQPLGSNLLARYENAVSEKGALEALVTSLRSHLSRLTTELSSHQALLTELRTLRESDMSALKEKSDDVDRLRVEVERLAGEVEVLRGVVEEGLKERREARDERSVGIGTVADAEADLSGVARGEEADLGMSRDEPSDEEEEEEEAGRGRPQDRSFILGSPRMNPDRTIRTDRATIASNTTTPHPPHTGANNGNVQTGNGASEHQFIDTDVLERISEEVEERRRIARENGGHFSGDEADISRASIRSQGVLERTPSPSPPPSPRMPQPPPPQVRRAESRVQAPPSRPMPGPTVTTNKATSRPTAPTPNHARGYHDEESYANYSFSRSQIQPQPRTHHQDGHHDRFSRHHREQNQSRVEETPFPQIRGEQLERLFFSAPEHNANTCTVCQRQKRPADTLLRGGHANGGRLSEGRRPGEEEWLPSRRDEAYRSAIRGDGSKKGVRMQCENEDEGFEEGDEDDEEHTIRMNRRSGPGAKGKERVRDTVWAENELPPQALVRNVVRELEDDFTHYKSIYVELAQQYAVMDAVSDVPRRNLLAKHVTEVLAVLEQKGDQIAALTKLLTVREQPFGFQKTGRGEPQSSKPRSGPGGVVRTKSNTDPQTNPTAGPSGWNRSNGGAMKRHPTFA
ncbi:hypothetical protein BDN72DRAFT_797730 [Pluteus cervinus]|uniref:Uncharacterized protein n=1 Tax=Pluteus cervinus TaxID=181527 RepID=A0ACD3ASX3_9AGAR|nr:hypothetical protein BDN72DRAFT_797730 [Pluteus cervinus]